MKDILNNFERIQIEKYFNLSKGKENPITIWIIGRSAAGKTTVATLLRDLLQSTGHRIELVDGEIMRSLINGNLGFSESDRMIAFKKYVYINQLLQDRGIIPITSTIAGFKIFRDIVRQNTKNPRFIYLDCPFKVAAERDQKGLYEKAIKGQIKNFFGIDLKYEIPSNYEIRINSAEMKPEEIVENILNHFQNQKLLE